MFFITDRNTIVMWLHKLAPPCLSPPGLLCSRVSLHPSQLLQTEACWGQRNHSSSVCAPSQFHSSWLGDQCDCSFCLASSQLPQAPGISRGPVLCGGMPFGWFHLWACSLPLYQHQGGSAWVSYISALPGKPNVYQPNLWGRFFSLLS